jgi:hypothetical protein
MVYVYLRAPALLAALLLLSPTSSRQSTEGANAVVVQHLFLGGDGLASGDINGTTFETSGLVTLRGVVFACAAMSCPGRAKHSVTVCGAPLARYGTGAIALRRSADSARTWGPLLFINATVDSLERDVLAGPVPVADEETGSLFVSWARKQSPPQAQSGGLDFLDAWVAKSTDLVTQATRLSSIICSWCVRSD